MGSRPSTENIEKGHVNSGPGRTPPPCTARRTACPGSTSYGAGKESPILTCLRGNACRHSDMAGTTRSTCPSPYQGGRYLPPPLCCPSRSLPFARFCAGLPNHGPRRAPRHAEMTEQPGAQRSPAVSCTPCHFGPDAFPSVATWNHARLCPPVISTEETGARLRLSFMPLPRGRRGHKGLG